jgi:uncharacterized membrane protein YphA (DoxX/SURF4 family)
VILASRDFFSVEIRMTHFSLHFPRWSAFSVAPIPCRMAGMAAALLACAAAPAALAHEAWLLTPAEVSDLSRTPIPALFTNRLDLGIAALAGCAVAIAALAADDRLRPFERRISGPLVRLAPAFGPLVIRLGLAIMLGLGSLGGLPRNGTATWAEPTLFVPDMQLALAPGWERLAPVEAALAVFLLLGLLTRLAGLLLVALAVLGLQAFGLPFLQYAPHFVAPGLMLYVCGGGTLSFDGHLDIRNWLEPPATVARWIWTACLPLVGGCFVYLAVSVKLTQPTLIMAILDHGKVPVMGLPLAFAALMMAGVEIIAGTLLAVGRLTRPISLFLIGAFTFFAVTIGETPLFHANLYGVCGMLLLSGRPLPAAAASARLPQAVSVLSRSRC